MINAKTASNKIGAITQATNVRPSLPDKALNDQLKDHVDLLPSGCGLTVGG
jgi:hypothetical protein